MTPRYLLDSDICVSITRGRGAQTRERLEDMRGGEIGLSVVVYGELMAGAHKSANTSLAFSLIAALVSLAPVLPLDINVALIYGELRATLESQGRIIGRNDLWIAAHALAINATLVTNNTREFKRVRGLKLENWLC